MQQPETRYARSVDVSIAYQVIGDGPVDVVYVPGFVSKVELARTIPQQAAGIRTVFQTTYPPTRTNFTSIMRRVAAAHPDVLVSGTQSVDAYAQVKALIKVHFKPKWFYLSNGANSPTEFPDQVGAQHVDGLMSGSDWLPSASDQANADFIRAYLAKFGGTAQNIDPTSAEAFSAGVLLQDVADRTGRLDNATIIRSLPGSNGSRA